jgi:uncharacterized protein (DUF1501 family)
MSRAAMLQPRLRFDTHAGNDAQGGLHDQLFAGLRVLLDGLAGRAGARAGNTLLDETVVVVVSEMSRTPKLNANNGKDHWPVTSAMVIGAGVRGGRAYGGTTRGIEAKKVNLATGELDAGGATIQTDELAAGVLELCGVDPAAYFPGVERLRGFIA